MKRHSTNATVPAFAATPRPAATPAPPEPKPVVLNGHSSHPTAPAFAATPRPAATPAPPPEPKPFVLNGHSSHPTAPAFAATPRPAATPAPPPEPKPVVLNGHSLHPTAPAFAATPPPAATPAPKPLVMKRHSSHPIAFAAVVLVSAVAVWAAPEAVQVTQTKPVEGSSDNPSQLVMTVGKSAVVDSPVNIQRVSVADPKMAEAVAVNPREVLVHALAPGETTLILWQQGGRRLFFDLLIRPSSARIDAVRQQLAAELEGQQVSLVYENDTPFLRGTVKDLTSADRAMAIASTLGKPVNLLHVNVPPVEPQILLKVRFANVDRAASLDLGVNLFSTGALNTPGQVTTGQFSPPNVEVDRQGSKFTLGDALNVFLFRPDLDLGATIRALQARRALEILAEPNVMTINGKAASFVAGGEFPFPTLQGGGSGLGAVTIQFREFGVRINFTPVITPRNTIRLNVTPEVSALDFANGLVFQGFNIPALSTRRVATEIELEAGQSFAIAGLLDNRMTETLNKVPGLANIPILGKLFQSKASSRNTSELLVLVTPELVRPIPAGQPLPEILPQEFLEQFPKAMPRTPGLDVTGPVPVQPARETLPVEELARTQKGAPPSQPAAAPQLQFVPVLTPPASQQPAAPPGPAAAAPAPGGPAAQ